MFYKTSVLKNSKFTDKYKKRLLRCSVKRKDVLKNFANFTEKFFAVVSFIMKLQAGKQKLSGAATGDVL